MSLLLSLLLPRWENYTSTICEALPIIFPGPPWFGAPPRSEHPDQEGCAPPLLSRRPQCGPWKRNDEDL